MRHKNLDFSNTFVFGQAHLDHNKEFIYSNRGFGSCEEHDERIIEEIMNTPKHANIISMGDMFFNTSYNKAVEIIQRITKGHDGSCDRVFHMMCGAHDYKMFCRLVKDKSVRVVKLGEICWLHDIRSNPQEVIVCNLPLEQWFGQRGGVPHIHAQMLTSDIGDRRDCCVDSLLPEFGSTVVSLDRIINSVKEENHD